jgi:tripartite-type tricarboxylate transporter receptor subunit TctC
VKYTWNDFAPICGLASGLTTIAVQSQARWKSMKEILVEAKEKPGMISYISGSGAMGITTLIAEAFFKENQIHMKLIPAEGSAPAVLAILGGKADSLSTMITPAFASIQAGTLRSLVVFTDKRHPKMPNVPTAVELGSKVSVPALYGLLAPKGTSTEVVETIAKAAKKASEEHQASVESAFSKSGMLISYTGPKEYSQFLKLQDDYWSKAIKNLDLKI